MQGDGIKALGSRRHLEASRRGKKHAADDAGEIVAAFSAFAFYDYVHRVGMDGMVVPIDIFLTPPMHQVPTVGYKKKDILRS